MNNAGAHRYRGLMRMVPPTLTGVSTKGAAGLRAINGGREQ